MLRAVAQLVSVVLIVGLAGVLFGQQTRVANTPHNLNNLDVWGVTVPQDQVCLPCHTPHNANTTISGAPLWNHELTGATFTMYPGVTNQPSTESKLCLSCHDGTVAIDSYGGNEGHFNNVKIPPWRSSNLGTDLSDDHPIGVTYPDGDPGFHPASGLQGVQLIMVNGDDRVECTSCHTPHNNGLGNFLRVTPTGSLLCLECHNK